MIDESARNMIGKVNIKGLPT